MVGSERNRRVRHAVATHSSLGIQRTTVRPTFISTHQCTAVRKKTIGDALLLSFSDHYGDCSGCFGSAVPASMARPPNALILLATA